MKLNKALREELIAEFKAQLFKKKFDAIEKRAKEMTLELYNMIVPLEVQALCKQIPANLLRTHICVYPSVTRKVIADGEERTDTVYLSERRNYCNHFAISLGTPIVANTPYLQIEDAAMYARALALSEERDALREKHTEALAALTTLINTSKTTEDLMRNWPEGVTLSKKFKEIVERRPVKPMPLTVALPATLLTEALS